MPQSSIVFITGANRGIGLGLAQEMAKRGHTVLAGYRSQARSQALLQAGESLPSLRPVQVDITTETDLQALHDLIATDYGRLDILVNNAAVNLSRGLPLNEVSMTDLLENFRVNVGGPFLTTRYLHPLLKQGRDKKVINISSGMGSISQDGGGATPYRISKTALNMLTSNQAHAYRQDGISVVCVNPGWVRTDMGGASASLSVEESTAMLLQNIERTTPETSGQFLGTNGETLPW